LDVGLKNPPLVFANRVIRRMVDNFLGDDVIVTKENYLCMRTVFRSQGGSWERVAAGDIEHTRLLSRLVMAWGNLPGRRREVDEVYDDN